MYPITKLRRLRGSQWLRDLVSETCLLPHNLILPMFVTEGSTVQEEVTTMPGVYRQSMNNILKTVKIAASLGIKSVALFPCIDESLKSDEALEAYNPNNLICRTVDAIKNAGIEIGVICDVALDPYTLHGHDGIVINGDVDNDKTLQELSRQALTLAKCGVDVIAPSDMMDGRVKFIRSALDEAGYSNITILSYAAKYNSSFYGPFRNAVGSDKKSYLSKATYQMDIRNSAEAIREIEADIAEGADIIMIKPALPYLDIIRSASERFDVNIFAFQVSGEYSSIKIASVAGAINWERSILESLICIKRAGARAIMSYAAIEVAELIG